nr:hypothetical protein [Rhodothermus marinus]
MRYEPGELRAVAYKNGRKWAEAVVQTTGQPTALAAEADRVRIQADGYDLAFITVRVVDAEGRTVPTADNPVRFTVEGPGELVATANGDPTSFIPFSSAERPAFNGLVLAIVRARRGMPGTITVTASAPGLRPARIVIESQ